MDSVTSHKQTSALPLLPVFHPYCPPFPATCLARSTTQRIPESTPSCDIEPSSPPHQNQGPRVWQGCSLSQAGANSIQSGTGPRKHPEASVKEGIRQQRQRHGYVVAAAGFRRRAEQRAGHKRRQHR